MKLSLAGWSLHRLFRAPNDPLRMIDFPQLARDRFALEAVELNSPFFPNRDSSYLHELSAAAEKANVKLLNIAVDEVGDLSADDDEARAVAVVNYGRWIPVAAELGCSAIRCNTGGMGLVDISRAMAACIDSFRRLCDQGVKQNITVLVENHGGLSSTADRMVQLIREVRMTHGEGALGALPDFGNWPEGTDRYASLAKIMPLAKAVHAKVLDIDSNLHHPKFDLDRCVKLTRDAGYNGYLGLEYEGPGEQIEGVDRAIRKLTPLL